mgnify:CR=1 FL=1|jgi:mRNA interferase RelE/StbE|tara:strand:+ start:1038 stop:1295 length:258 start_codon:yes stop_codon:yes gene_type:complete
MLEVKFSKISEKFLKKCDDEIYERIIKKIKKLSEKPFPSDCKKISDKEGKLFRIRVGDYRLIYEVFYNKNALIISKINKRSKIYK